jgi:hypothetical protein
MSIDPCTRACARRRRTAIARRLANIDWCDDRGQVGGIEVLPFGLLIFVVGALLIANTWAVIDAKSAVDAATREAVRSFVEAPDAATGAERADEVAREAVAGHGRNPTRLVLDPPVYDGGAGFARCTAVTFRGRYPVPALTLPWIGGLGDGFLVSASHTEIIDPYRSGVRAGGTC